ncbi:copper-binding protein [Luteimonas mephitis]|uniref:copper-binding protein n=1 Tax=Luteimonas mephitis TaxID=83615 RepID=UPI000565BF19|nr:copper-binding protein [Luteimonas mephitis]
MKLLTSLLTVALLAACSQETSSADTAANAAASPEAQSMDMSEAEHQAMDSTTDDAAGTPAAASGTVESVDAEAGKIVIAHGAVDALEWPAMTMGFSATHEQIQTVQPGQRVDFEFLSQGSKNTITSIAPAQ